MKFVTNILKFTLSVAALLTLSSTFPAQANTAKMISPDGRSTCLVTILNNPNTGVVTDQAISSSECFKPQELKELSGKYILRDKSFIPLLCEGETLNLPAELKIDQLEKRRYRFYTIDSTPSILPDKLLKFNPGDLVGVNIANDGKPVLVRIDNAHQLQKGGVWVLEFSKQDTKVKKIHLVMGVNITNSTPQQALAYMWRLRGNQLSTPAAIFNFGMFDDKRRYGVFPNQPSNCEFMKLNFEK
jgi:hypothetical protein